MAITNKTDELKTRMDEVVLFLQDVSYEKINNYIDNNITNLASAKAFLKKLTKLVIYMVREI